LGCNGGSAGICGGGLEISVFEQAEAQSVGIGWVNLKGSERS